MSRGVIIGKFMPPHLGHKYMVDFATSYAKEVMVMVCTRRSEPIDGKLRYQWMEKLCPKARVVWDTAEPPGYPEDHPDFWNIWKRLIEAHSRLTFQDDRKIDYVFGSEDYCIKLAEVLGATYIPVDKNRRMVPTSGTNIRNNPMVNWRYIPDIVRPYYVKRVCVYGPESTGKTTLTDYLANYFLTVGVEEYARPYLDARGRKPVLSDIEVIARGQWASQQALATQANQVLVMDTDAVTTKVWSDVLFGTVPPIVEETIAKQKIDLYLLMDIDVPWVADGQRDLGTPEQRRDFYNRLKHELDVRGLKYVTISGTYEQRQDAAVAAIDALLESTIPKVHA